MQLNSQDREILKQGVEGRFRWMIVEFLQEKRESLHTGIISRLDPELSKTKWNDKDFALAEMMLIDEVLDIPELIWNLINNEDLSQN